ncbi:MAG: quinolinate synthase NadA [Oscillospiraceae bacterium]|nr:quinolinate synthase NadA [Oscillospiraceae bacterium]
MRTISDVQASIKAYQAKTGVTILAHSYQSPEILEIADITGDSYKLSAAAKEIPSERLLVCGVHFMAETAKLLNPEKTVYEANPLAGCPMAEQFTPDEIRKEREKYEDCAVVAYVNTTAAIKAVSDVCVTSSSAIEIVKRIPNRHILFIPDCNLGAYVQSKCPEKTLHFLKGGCPYHGAVTLEEAKIAKSRYPDAKLLVHPECKPEISALADYVGATSGILTYAKQSDAAEFIIGTEISIVMQLQLACPEKRFYPISTRLICPDMRITTVSDIERVLRNIAEGSAKPLELDADTAANARHALDEMLRLGG